MADLIDRQAVIDALKNMYDAAEKWRCEAKDEVIKARAESCMASLIEMKLRIEKLPSVQPERKPGKWDSNRCSECGFGVLLSPYMHNLDTGEYTLLYKFCPNCGAKMEGDN